MGKIEGSKRSRGSGDKVVWSASDHTIRKAKQQRKGDEKQEERERRSALLTRDSKEKREAGKLRLHIKRAQRQIEKMRERLEAPGGKKTLKNKKTHDWQKILQKRKKED
jgi:hypothetical protein